MNVQAFWRAHPMRIRSTTLLLSLTFLAIGCSRPASESASKHPPEPTLAEQAQAVRDGESNQLRLDHTLVRDQDLQQLDGLETKLLRINFSKTEITDAGLKTLSRMQGLEQVRLASPKISDDGLAALENLSQLRFLHLLDMPITDAALTHLYGLKKLESLYLDGTRVTDSGIEQLFKQLPDVHLHIDDHHHRLDPHGLDHKHSE